MAKKVTRKPATKPVAATTKKVERSAKAAALPVERIRFTARLLQPLERGNSPDDSWWFVKLPKSTSAKLPSRGMVSVEGTISGAAFQATLQPDGDGSHWLRVDQSLCEAAGAKVGDSLSFEIAPLPPHREPEPNVPADLRKALKSADAMARDVWDDITPVARRDWIAWIVSAKKDETRAKRIATACDMLAKGKRRPCCFDRSGMYDKSLSCPTAVEE